jgi:hypothetical protein
VGVVAAADSNPGDDDYPLSNKPTAIYYSGFENRLGPFVHWGVIQSVEFGESAQEGPSEGHGFHGHDE